MNEPLLQLTIIEKDQKYCTKCKSFKPITDFGKTQKRFQCKACYSRWKKEYLNKPGKKEKERGIFLRGYFKRKYGITYDQYQDMFLKQDGKCAICKKEKDYHDFRSAKRINLAVDHCHATGKVRELLCITCNHGIGSFKEDLELMKKAMEYLEKHK